MKIFALGSNSIRNTFDIKYKDWEVEEYLWASPFAICQKGNAEYIDFTTKLSQTQASYFVLDLFGLSFYVDKTSDGFIHSKKANVIEGAQVLTLFNDKTECKKCLDSLIELISEKFDKNHIIIIKTKKANKYCKDQLVRALPNANEVEFNKTLEEYEDYFISKTKCLSIDVFGAYFMDKYNRFGESQVNYESFAYDNIKYNLSQIFENNRIGNCLFIKLQRYLKYGDFLERSFKINWLFSNEDVVDDFISHTSVKFVKEFYSELVKLDQLSIKNTQQLLSNAKSKCGCKVVALVEWYVAYKQNKYKGLVFEEFLLEYKLSLINKLVGFCNYNIAKQGIKNHIVTNKNIKEYIPYLVSNDFASLDKKQSDCQPVKIDIWGSCISREIFKYIDANVVLGNYIYRASGLQINDPVVDIPLSEIENLDNFNGSQWRSDFIKNNLYRETANRLANTKSKWLMIDLYDFVELTYQLNDNAFILDYDTTLMPFYKVLVEKYGVKELGFHSYKNQDLKDRLDAFANLISTIYGQNIILTNTRFSKYYISDSGEIIKFNRNENELDDKNAYLKYCQDYLIKKLDCYVLDLSDKFLADERFVWGESPVHYERLFFEFTAKMVADIVNGIQKDKKISNLSNEIVAGRIIGILKRIKRLGGKNAPKYYETLSNSIDKNILALYNNSICNIE